MHNSPAGYVHCAELNRWNACWFFKLDNLVKPSPGAAWSLEEGGGVFCVFFVSMYVLHFLHKWACMGHIKKGKKEEKKGVG